MALRKITLDQTTDSIGAAATDDQDFTIPDDCVDVEVQFFSTVQASTGANEHAVSFRTSSAEVLEIAQWDVAGNHYITFPPPPTATIVRVHSSNGSAAGVTFRMIVTFWIEVNKLT